MRCEAINNCLNPCSQGQVKARETFHGLTTMQKVATVVLSALAWIGTIFMVGVGGYAVFKALVEHFSIEIRPPLSVDILEYLGIGGLFMRYQENQEYLLKKKDRAIEKEQERIIRWLPTTLKDCPIAELEGYKKQFAHLGDEVKSQVEFVIKRKVSGV